MLNRFFVIFFFVLLFVNANNNAQVKRETRAVWLTTNFRLDWPPPVYNSETQKKELVKILDDLKDKKFNTIYFQVRFNGTVFYKSTYEPYSFYLTGKVGGTPDYDPLEFIIKEAHTRGMEVHAWLNMVNTFSGTESQILENSNHLFNKHSNWLIPWFDDNRKSYWLDPGIPEARDYLTEIVKEVAANYDVDGIQFDFLRYPGRTFNDQLSYAAYGQGLDKDNWRRDNLTHLVENIYHSVKAIKPLLKIGVAPIGIYKSKPGASGWEGYSEVYQDSREWLKREIIDYVVPQIYWDFKKNPFFDIVAKDWQDNAYNRSVILGVGAYQKTVYPEMDKMISYARQINSGGVAFFRYGNIKDANFPLFDEYAYPTEMPWLKLNLPNPPQNLRFELSGFYNSNIKLIWDKPVQHPENVKYYSIYRLPNSNSPFNSTTIYDIISSNKDNIQVPMHRPRTIKNLFAVKSLNSLFNESEVASNIAEVIIPQLEDLSQSIMGTDKIVLLNENGIGTVIINVFENDTVELRGKRDSKTDLILSKKLFKGKNIISVKNIDKYSSLSVNYLSAQKSYELKLN